MTPPEALLLDLDKLWQSQGEPRIRIRILGSMSLMLQTDYERGTKDGDILYAHPVDGQVKDRLLSLGGQGTVLATRHRVYIDVVTSGILMLPAQPKYIPIPDLTARLTNFEVEALSIPDVVISKLKPFRPTDIADINAMILRGHITHDQFLSLFQSAVDRFADGATGTAKLPQIVQNFNQIERDSFGVEETEIELPPWVDED
jgi:hypothetical protein